MSLQELKSSLPEYAKDIKLNLGSILTEEGATGLTQKQVHLVALACACATKSDVLLKGIQSEVRDQLSDTEQAAAKGAATIMAMNNVYYRFLHLVGDSSFSTMPAGLRMSFISKSGVEKIDFELMSLAVSAINGCGMCIESHTKHLVESGLQKTGIQSAVKIASVIAATALALSID